MKITYICSREIVLNFTHGPFVFCIVCNWRENPLVDNGLFLRIIKSFCKKEKTSLLLDGVKRTTKKNSSVNNCVMVNYFFNS